MTINAAGTSILSRLMHAMGAHFFRKNDELARRHGWAVEIRQGGLGRGYRDPRFDTLAHCPACLGTGSNTADRLCQHCAGSGRITLRRQGQVSTGRSR